MTATAAQVQFAAEFVTFLVAAAGLALVVLRNELTTSRPPERLALTVGFLTTALAAFMHGSLLLKAPYDGVVIGLRVAGIAGLGIGAVLWGRGRGVARQLLWIGLGGSTIAVILEAIGAGRASDVALASGSILIGAALLVASRRSVAARVAASAAGTLLLVVLVLAVALSAVLSSSVEREELNQLQTRARTEATLASQSYLTEIQTARVVALFLFSQGPLTKDEVAGILNGLQDVYQAEGGGFVVLVPQTSVGGSTTTTTAGASAGTGAYRIVGSLGTSQDLAVVLAGYQVAHPTCQSPRGTGSVEVVGTQLFALAAYDLCPTPGAPIGIVVRESPLNDSYLATRNRDDTTLSLAIVNASGVLAKAGRLPPTKSLTALSSAVMASGLPVNRVLGGRYVAAQPLQRGNGVVVVSTPTSAVAATRDRLFRTLFLIALGGTLIALGLAVVIGDRITAGLRRLTLAAENIQQGLRGQRSGITSDDEVGVLGAAFDSMADSIEEQTRALRSAADDETRLRSRMEAVVAGMGDALVAVDAHGRITDFNQAAEEMTGITASQSVGELVDDVVLLVKEDGTSLGPRLRTPSPTRWGMLATAVDLNGTEFPVAVSAGALRGPGNQLIGQVLVLRDLRREREVERMKTEFLSRVGHELRTPLTGIMGYADFLLRRAVPAERAQLCHEEILVSAKRLLRVVEMLEFFASSGAGRVLLRPEPLDVPQLIDGVVAPWKDRLVAPSTIASQVPRGVPEINGDRRWLALAVDELIDNAVKFSPGGAQVTVAVAVAAGRPARPPRFTGPGASNAGANGHAVAVLEISVSDRGKGMTPDEQATAFGEFVQGDSSDTRQFGGLGLGLSLVQRVVEGHGGTVRCSSTVGKGTTFTIILPIPYVEPEPDGEKKTATDDAEQRRQQRSAN